MAGILFLRARELERVRRFYEDRVGMSVWLEQPGIAILKHGNLLIGFHEQPEADLDGLITFFEQDRSFVDRMYEEFKDTVSSAPKENTKYRIYHFFAQDPEGRRLEFQTFLHDLPPI